MKHSAKVDYGMNMKKPTRPNHFGNKSLYIFFITTEIVFIAKEMEDSKMISRINT